jgi:flagellar hook assembly protein FlgD
MTSPIPMVANASSLSGTGAASNTTQSTPSNTLGPNSFITLLTAQLQAQDPLSPMDPDQMVNELTSINTLQQLVQIRTDMDTLVGALPSSQSGSGGGAGSSGATSASSINSATNAAAKLYSNTNSNSQSI